MNASMSNSLTRIPWQAYVIAMAMLPSLGVLGARTLLPSRGPSQAAAAQPVGTVTAAAPSRMEKANNLGAQDQAFLDYIAASTSMRIERSPIAQRHSKNSDDRPPTITTSQEGEPELSPTESSVTSILKANGQLIAMIGGKLRRVGDRLSGGWSIKDIDADGGTVTVVHISGHTKTVSLRKKQ